VVVETLAVSVRAIVILAVLLIAALAWWVWMDKPGPSSNGERIAALVDHAPETIRAIEMVYRSRVTRLERDESGAWRVSLPNPREADPRKVEGLLRALSEVAVVSVVNDHPGGDLDAFGLETSAGSLLVFTESDTPARRIELGGRSPVGDEVYVRDENGAVLLVEGSIVELLGRVPGSFVERRFVPVEADGVRAITVRGPASGFRLERRDATWWLTEPLEDLVDATAGERLIRAVSELRAIELLDSEEIDLARGSFATPIRLTVETGSGEAPGTVEIGAPAGRGKWFARRSGSTEFWGIVDEEQVRELAREVDDLRDRRLAPFSRPDVREVRIETGDGVLTLARSEGRSWTAKQGDGASSLTREGVEAFLDRLRWLRAAGFGVSGGRPGERILEVVLSGEAGELGRLTVQRLRGARGSDEGALLVARSSWRPGFVFTVAAEDLDAVPRSVDDLEDLSEEASREDEAA
jgi:hypothetical protein